MSDIIMKATTPITGGKNIPPVEAVASTAAATVGLKPVLFIKGMVTVPVITMLAAGEPLIIPTKPLATTEV